MDPSAENASVDPSGDCTGFWMTRARTGPVSCRTTCRVEGPIARAVDEELAVVRHRRAKRSPEQQIGAWTARRRDEHLVFAGRKLAPHDGPFAQPIEVIGADVTGEIQESSVGRRKRPEHAGPFLPRLVRVALDWNQQSPLAA